MSEQPTLRGIQLHLADIYGETNAKAPLWAVAARLHVRASSFPAIVEKHMYQEGLVQTAQIFSWVCGTANHPSVALDMESGLLRRFPGICPYCGHCPCDCSSNRAKQRLPQAELDAACSLLPADIDIQEMLGRIYPRNGIGGAVPHMTAEVGEFMQEVIKASSAKEWNPFPTSSLLTPGMADEICDLLAHLFAIANLTHLRLLAKTWEIFEHGCPPCIRRSGLISSSLVRCACDVAGITMGKVGSRTET